MGKKTDWQKELEELLKAEREALRVAAEKRRARIVAQEEELHKKMEESYRLYHTKHGTF